MAVKFVTLALLGVARLSYGQPVITLQDLEGTDDTHYVGSYIREVRAAPPQPHYRSYQSEGDGELGYSRKKSGGGKKGYQHFDSYHKKAGDNYEFEKQDSYGKDNEDEEGAYSNQYETKADKHRSGKKRSPRSDEHHSSRTDGYNKKSERYRKPNDSEENSDDVEEVPEDGPSNERIEKDHEELREGAPDGNGGVESYGHDPKDYVLPEKYTYGAGDEYDF